MNRLIIGWRAFSAAQWNWRMNLNATTKFGCSRKFSKRPSTGINWWRRIWSDAIKKKYFFFENFVLNLKEKWRYSPIRISLNICMCVRVLFLNYKKKKCAEEFKSVLWPFEQPKRRRPWQYQAREFPISGRMSTHPLGVSICCWWRILSVASFSLAARSLWASAAGAWKQDGRPWRVYFEGGEAVSPPCIKSTQKKMFGLKDAGNWFIMQRGGCLKQKVSAKAVRTTTSVFWLVEGRRGAESAKRAWTAAAAPVITWFVYLFGRKTRTSIGGPCCTLNRNLLLKWWRNPNTSAIRWADLGNFSSIEQKKKMRNCDVAAFYWSDDAIHMRSWSSDNWLTWKKRKRKKMRLLLSRDVGGGWQVTGEHEAFTCRFSCFFLFKSKKRKKRFTAGWCRYWKRKKPVGKLRPIGHEPLTGNPY